MAKNDLWEFQLFVIVSSNVQCSWPWSQYGKTIFIVYPTASDQSAVFIMLFVQ